MLSQLKKYVLNHEDWLMVKILSAVKQRDYTQYAATLKETWRLTISGVSSSLINGMDVKGQDLELGPHEEYIIDERIKKADKVLYMAKKQGRNRGVCL